METEVTAAKLSHPNHGRYSSASSGNQKQQSLFQSPKTCGIMAASEAEVFRRRGKMTHEMHSMGLVGFHEHDRRIGDEHAAVFNMACRAQERKERLAKAAQLPPSAAARWNPGDAKRQAQLLRRARSLGLSDPQPSNAIGPPAATTSNRASSPLVYSYCLVVWQYAHTHACRMY